MAKTKTSRLINLIGQKFGKLLVIDIAPNAGLGKNAKACWTCRCECNKEVIIPGKDLKSGNTKSCGDGGCRGLRSELEGLKFGLWSVIKPVKRSKVMWLCECLCGKLKEVRGDQLVNGESTSCGCSRGHGSSLNNSKVMTIARYKNGAKTRGIAFELDYDATIRLFESNCHYCGRAPFNVVNFFLRKDRTLHTKFKNMSYEAAQKYDYVCNGIDRKDNLLGYTLDNCLPCCTKCNWAKRDMVYADFIVYLDTLVAYRTNIGEKK